jgi:hypothetical protein
MAPRVGESPLTLEDTMASRESSAEHPDLVDLERAHTPFEAEVIAGVLRDAGIAVYIEGRQLTDEFALSPQLLNLQGVIVKVRATEVERAREALAAAREAGRSAGEAAADPAE